ncbi:MAG: hypothetical protein JW891_17825 [Candidatus Lokiarchaeota archaeon]|nr:hypothetical protein [Candidatus Lokiarchaeota archaeon]
MMIILCLGDSLTAGYPGYGPAIDGISYGYGNEKSQYEYWLEKMCYEYSIQKNCYLLKDKSYHFSFINKGIPGELTSNLLERINVDLIKNKPKPDYSIIIGGTNDLGWGISPDQIAFNIKQLHEISREGDIVSIGSTIPPIRREQSSTEYRQKKNQLNNLLVEYFVENGISFADLYVGMMNKNGNLKKDCAYVDGLHFSEEGYKQMGMILFNDVFKNLLDDRILKRR